MRLLLTIIILSCICFNAYTESYPFNDAFSNTMKLDISQAIPLWNRSIKSFDTTSYVYELQKYCDECSECDTESKYIIIDDGDISNVEYVNKTTECLVKKPILYTYLYRSVEEWFDFIKEYGFQVTYDNNYGYPQTIIQNEMDSTVRYQILCIAFIKNQRTLNSFQSNHCSEYSLNNRLNDEYNDNDDIRWNDHKYNDNDDVRWNDHKYNDNDNIRWNDQEYNRYNTTISVNFSGCSTEIIESDDCTEWVYVYITTILSVVLSALSIICFWLYHRQGINPATKGYKKSKSHDFVNENDDDDDSDTDEQLHGDNIFKNKKRKKKRGKLLGIDENKQIPGIKIKKKMKNKYGSIAQTDEDEKFDNPFDIDNSEQSDDWHFVSDNKKDHNNNNNNNQQIQNGASGSDQTDEEEED